MAARLLHRVAARDRALLERLMLAPDPHGAARAVWCVITHSGGALTTLLASLAPLCFDSPLRDGARSAALLLVTSHLLVQLVKRFVSRPRPTVQSALAVPDRFSFPSGHAAAALAVALGYASSYPDWTVPLLALAGLAGASRVVLGVHFPADVLAGQIISLMTAAALVPVL